MIVGKRLRGFDWSKGEKKRFTYKQVEFSFFPCIVLNVKYLWVCDNVFAGVYCSGCIL